MANKPLRAPIAEQEDDLDDTPSLSPPLEQREDDQDDTPVSPLIAKQDEDVDDTPLTPPIAQQEDDIGNTPLSPPIAEQADGRDETPLHQPILRHKHFSADDLNTINLKLKKIKTNWFECCTHFKQLSDEVIKFKADLEKERIAHRIQGILGNRSQIENEEPRVPLGLATSVYQRKKIEVYVQAEERLRQQQNNFRKHKNMLIQNQYPFEQFHGVLQAKVKFLEKLTPEMFCNYENVERHKVLRQILMSAEECYLEKKCGELYDEAMRNNNLLRITYGFPEKPKQDDIDEIERKFTNYKRLCDRLRYSLY